MASTTFVTLSNGVKIPQFGLGTWQSKPEEVKLAVKSALDEGYRLIDTATVYQNEKDIGEALKEYFDSGKLKRSDVFVVTKLWVSHNRPEDVEPTLRESLKLLQLDYIDLYLIHQPVTYDHQVKEQDHSVKVEDSWRGMEGVYEKGLAKAIGISNFNDSQIERIMKVAKVPIHNSQVELHLHFQQDKHVATCKKHNISVTAYAPLGSPGRSNFTLPTGQKLNWKPAPDPLKHQFVLKLAEKYKKTPAQILLRHLLQKGILIIPKSINPSRIHENAQVFDFELSAEELDYLNKVEQGSRLFLQDFCEGHPEDPFADERQK
ncbi:Oxidoreductase, aldo/keto reductase family protein [Aphelenchoides bicaudatus]|nr:Oxidoreductase, aldo/keto reductase family protein [Aphelenchoides bicaudatus]